MPDEEQWLKITMTSSLHGLDTPTAPELSAPVIASTAETTSSSSGKHIRMSPSPLSAASSACGSGYSESANLRIASSMAAGSMS